MSDPDANSFSAQQTERDIISDLFHSLSQPLTALECGLEVSLRQDRSVAQLRARMASALETAQLLHQRLLEARALQDAGEAGDTALPLPLESLLSQLQEDFLLVASSARVKLTVDCEPAMVRGNDARIRNGFFHLFEFLLHASRPRHTVRIRGARVSPTLHEVRFTVDSAPTSLAITPAQTASPSDIGLRIAERIFQAVNGNLVLSQDADGKITGFVRLLLAN